MKYLAVLFLVFFTVGCSNPAYQRQIGTGPITLSDRAQASFEEYLDSNPSVFAVTEDGSTSWGWYYCPENEGCRGNNFVYTGPAIRTCEKHSRGKPCKIYALGRKIVWKTEEK
jgi:hypothetical protein